MVNRRSWTVWGGMSRVEVERRAVGVSIRLVDLQGWAKKKICIRAPAVCVAKKCA